jgi:hypothetical protein
MVRDVRKDGTVAAYVWDYTVTLVGTSLIAFTLRQHFAKKQKLTCLLSVSELYYSDHPIRYNHLALVCARNNRDSPVLRS